MEIALRNLARPEPLRQLRRAVILVVLLWALLALARLVLALIPGQDLPAPTGLTVLNPAVQSTPMERGEAVDIDRLKGWHLFGAAGETGAEITDRPVPQAQADEREGIEKGARETRLDLRLVGVVAASEDGLGHAIIEYRNKQDIYAVEDKLPLPGQVTLAKVMTQQVVLDNGGTYELLKLFDDDDLSSQLPATAVPERAAGESPAQRRDAVGVRRLARDYRDRLYQDPQSLAEVVRVSAVREGDRLLGYRISPGSDREQFHQLGLRAGDLVTSINGIPLDDPANTVRLYQAMRSAEEAVFELTRDGQSLSLTVSLASEQ